MNGSRIFPHEGGLPRGVVPYARMPGIRGRRTFNILDSIVRLIVAVVLLIVGSYVLSFLVAWLW